MDVAYSGLCCGTGYLLGGRAGADEGRDRRDGGGSGAAAVQSWKDQRCVDFPEFMERELRHVPDRSRITFMPI